jgi:catechol 2,3-dioxygenase-like lactoylglutathione lyase family enzyme
MKFVCSLITVENIARSRQLYEVLLGQKVIADFGEFNVAFEGGLALYKRDLYQSLIGPLHPIQPQSNSFELYFEHDDLEGTLAMVEQNGFELVQRIKEEPWQQRVFRFYDADKNIVVIAETMEKVAYRLLSAGKTVEEIAGLTGEPTETVQQHIQDYQAAHP